jgi:hypothetical protein
MREAEPVFVNVLEPRNQDSASRLSLAGAGTKNRVVGTSPPGCESIPGLCKKNYKYGLCSYMQAYFFVMPHPQFCVLQGIFFFLFLVEQKDIISLLRELWILHNTRMCVF